MSNDPCEGCSRDCTECGLNVPREGPIIKGGGVSKPEWWDDEYNEYLWTAEGASELGSVSVDEPDDY